VTTAWLDDDDQLLSALKVALADDMPARFVDTAKASFTWRDIDAELAALSYDSARDELAGAATRAEPSAARYLTFDATDLAIELEIVGDALHGQVVPPQAGKVEVRLADGTSTTAPVNDVGYFTVPPPQGTFRVHCRTANGVVVQTGWITL